MKKLIAFFLFFFLVGSYTLVHAQEWQTSYAKAKSIASTQNKPILLSFQGSDWCGPCMQLDKKVWKTKAFKDYAAKNYVLLKADFPKRKGNKLSSSQQKANNLLASKYNKSGYFPLVVVLDSKGKVLGKTGYKKYTPTSFIATVNKFIK